MWSQSLGLKDLAFLIAVSLIARIVLFSGFIGGDDFAYASLAHEILTTGYPAVGPNVFASRPLFMVPVAASVGILGWSELALVTPVLVASLCGISCTYLLGTLLAGRLAGLIASVTLAVFPLDLVYASTMTNDIVGSAVLGIAALGSVLSISAALASRTRTAVAIGGCAGLVAGLAPAFKLSFLIGWIPLALIVTTIVAIDRRTLPAAAGLFTGWAFAQLSLMAFFWWMSGRALANYAVELGFNRAFMADPYLASRTDALLSYPNWAFGLRPAFPDSDRFFPYGLFFPLVIVAVIWTLRWGERRMWLLIAWFASIVLALEFWPLQLVPAYTPIHRLPRFLHLAAIPGALLIGAACAHAIARGGPARVIAIGLCLIYLVHAVGSSLIAVERHQDSMRDLRFGAAIALAFPGPIVTDAEMRGYLLFRRGFREIEKLRKVLGAQVAVPPHAMVIFGGGRRIDMDPDWAERRVPRHVPADWVRVAALPGLPKPWRRSQGAVYIAASGAKLQGKGFVATLWSAACGRDQQWRLVDIVDVGMTASEHGHAYRIDGQTFFGERMMFSRESAELEDDGRAFRGSQRFEVAGLTVGVSTCLIKRVDPSARRQTSRWRLGAQILGDMVADETPDGTWQEVPITIPGHLITRPRVVFTEEFVSGDVDVNSYRIEIYQAVNAAADSVTASQRNRVSSRDGVGRHAGLGSR